MGILFAQKTEGKIVRRDTIIFDYLRKLDVSIGNYGALYLCVHKLQGQNLRSADRQALNDTFTNLSEAARAELFVLPNEDMIVIFNKACRDEILACLVKIRFLLHDDPLIKNAEDLEAIGFARVYDLGSESPAFHDAVKTAMKSSVTFSREKAEDKSHVLPLNYGNGRKAKKELTTDMLAKVQKILSVADFSSFIRRQSVCAIIGKAAPQRVFEEVYVAIPDLRDMLLPDVDLTANPWLFQHLTETLDKRVLVSISRHDDGSLTSNFSINLNVSTILSDEFLEFDENINASMRSSIVLELQLVDIFSDVKAFILAKTFAQYRGYKICIDGITVDKLKYIDRGHLNSDLIKIIWHPSFMDVIREDKHFTDYVNKAERSRMILCRVDDPQAVEIGNSLGINLYQGRYIQRLLMAQPRKTIFSIKK